MMENTSLVSYISRLVSEAQPKPITGGQLAARVKVNFPDVNFSQFGCKNLRDFIKKQIPEVSERGQVGMDVLYGVRVQQAEMFEVASSEPTPASDLRAPLGQLLTNPRIWKTFASPESPYRLFISSSGTIRVIRPGESPDTAGHEVPPISAETLLAIAKDFVSGLPQTQQEILLRTMTELKWWVPYFELISTLGLRMRWVSFRRRRIVEEFERALSKVTSQLTPTVLSVQPQEPNLGSIAPSQSDSNIRRVAAFAVQRMSDAELRALNLPLGHVLDALMVNK